MTTPVGTPAGNATTQAITSSGGTVTAGGIKLEVQPGAVTDANITLQPITDTLNGSGQGIAISSDAPWSKYAKITFPIDPNETSPESLGLALQQPDGSWLALAPVKVDTVAGTVTAGLPATPAAAGVAGRPAAAGVGAQAARLNLNSVVLFKAFFIRPEQATVKTKGTQNFIPYAQVIQNEAIPCSSPVPNDPEDLTPLCRFRQVTRAYPFTNQKEPFVRVWYVNGVQGGNATVGTIVKSGVSGATYTAPDKKPSPDTVTVRFESFSTDTFDSVPPMTARVKITSDVIQAYTGSVNFNGSSLAQLTYSGQGNLTWNLVEDLPGDLRKYEASGAIQATTTYPGCAPATSSVAVNGTMIVFDPVRGGPGDPLAGKYWFSIGQTANVLVTTDCGSNPSVPTKVAMFVLASSACPEVATLPDAPKVTDIALLSDAGTWSCQFNTTTADWRFTAQ